MMMKIAFLTGGGDSAGINAALAQAILSGTRKHGATFIGIKKAFEGLTADNVEDYCLELGEGLAKKIFNTPSTILGSSRFAPFSEKNRTWAPEKIRANCRRLGIDAIIATGGNDTIKTSLGVHDLGIPVIAVPKSIDNDISCTDWMLGANTAVEFATKAFTSAAVSAETHARLSINEVMGREAGWLAFLTGVGTCADLILVPEKNFSLDALVERVARIKKEKGFVNIIVSEGIRLNREDPLLHRALAPDAKDQVLKAMLSEEPDFDPHGNMSLGGAGIIIQRLLSLGLGCRLSNIRQSNIGFALRGLAPNAFDINLGQRFGRKAMDLLSQGESGLMTAIHSRNIIAVPIADALPQNNLNGVDEDELKDFGVFF